MNLQIITIVGLLLLGCSTGKKPKPELQVPSPKPSPSSSTSSTKLCQQRTTKLDCVADSACAWDDQTSACLIKTVATGVTTPIVGTPNVYPTPTPFPILPTTTVTTSLCSNMTNSLSCASTSGCQWNATLLSCTVTTTLIPNSTATSCPNITLQTTCSATPGCSWNTSYNDCGYTNAQNTCETLLSQSTCQARTGCYWDTSYKDCSEDYIDSFFD